MAVTTQTGKQRPKNAHELIEFVTSSLDGRSKFASSILEVRELARTEPETISRGLCVDCLAVWAVVQGAVIGDITRLKDILSEGELNPLFNELERVTKNIIALNNTIQNIDTKASKTNNSTASKKKGRDLSTLFEG